MLHFAYKTILFGSSLHLIKKIIKNLFIRFYSK